MPNPGPKFDKELAKHMDDERSKNSLNLDAVIAARAAELRISWTILDHEIRNQYKSLPVELSPTNFLLP